MPKNKGKGGKNRRRGKNEAFEDRRELVFKEDGQEYAQVVKMLGNGRLEALCFDGEKRLAHIRGKMRKKVWINQGDIILLSLREFQDDKADVIQKYTNDEARNLKAYGELPETTKINETETFGGEDEDGAFEFGSADDDSDDGAASDLDVDNICASHDRFESADAHREGLLSLYPLMYSASDTLDRRLFYVTQRSIATLSSVVPLLDSVRHLTRSTISHRRPSSYTRVVASIVGRTPVSTLREIQWCSPVTLFSKKSHDSTRSVSSDPPAPPMIA